MKTLTAYAKNIKKGFKKVPHNSYFEKRTQCPCCHSHDYEIKLSLPFLDSRVLTFIETFYHGTVSPEFLEAALYEIAHCSQCDALWQRNILNPNGMRQLYEHWISEEESFAKKNDAEYELFAKYANEMNVIYALFNRKPSSIDVLDFGMGWGYWCRMAAAFNYRVSGFEISKQRIAYAQKFGITVVSDIQSLMAMKFDFINTEQVIEHVPKPLETLKLFKSLLKPEGVLRISVPCGRDGIDELKEPHWCAKKDAFQPLEHINIFTHESLKNLAKYAGFSCLEHLPPMANIHDTCLYFKQD